MPTIPVLCENANCCSALELINLGEPHDGWDYDPVATTLPAFKTALRKAVSTHDEETWDSPASHFSLVWAATTTTQPKARKFLRQLGFQELVVKKYKKAPHGISHFFMSAEDFINAIKE